MSDPTLNCLDRRRRQEIRKRAMNGLDYLEVSDDQLTLTVYFIGPAPAAMEIENLEITGGRRIRDIRVTDVKICPQRDPEIDNCMVVTVDKPGDFSTYTLCLVNLPEGHPFDPRYRCLDFSFKVNCPSELDCNSAPQCPPEERARPEIDYLAKDYASFRRLILDRMALIMPDWRERHAPDLGITLVELLAYVGDHLSYYQDAVGTEAYLQTARRRISVRRHAALVDYPMHEGCNARAWVHVDSDQDIALDPAEIQFITGHNQSLGVAGRVLTRDDLRNIPSSRYELFEPLVETPGKVQLRQAHNTIRLYPWGDAECCLPRGATSATLVDGPPLPPRQEPPPPEECGKEGEYESVDQDPGQRQKGGIVPPPAPERPLRLKPGDVLIFEEVIGPETGDPADADPTRRHAVRLSAVAPAIDELFRQPVLEVAWAREDALPFPLCVSTIGPAPGCRAISDVSVARGNVILVDHGRRMEQPEDLGTVPVEASEQVCLSQGVASDVTERPGSFRPRLARTPLTFSQPLAAETPASAALDQDPRQSLPWIRLASSAGAGDPSGDLEWSPRLDLLSSDGLDAHYVIEMDDRGFAHLRFGDGELGRAPEAGAAFRAVYRTGNGPAGNVGAEAISHLVSRRLLSGVRLEPRNPLPARGGARREAVAQVKLFAPHAFRRHLQRAVTPDDYAALVRRDFPREVQGAAAVLRWTGSWHEVLVAVDARGTAEADEELLDRILKNLHRYRRIGHDVVVRPARAVPLDVEMTICVAEGFLRGHVRAVLLDRFGNRALPDGSRGFFHPDNLTLGQALHLSRLVAAAQAVQGVDSVRVTRFHRLFEPPDGEIENGVLPLGPLETARLDNDPDFPENGKIQFDLRGGR